MSMTTERRNAVFEFLSAVVDSSWSKDEFLTKNLTGPEIAEFLTKIDTRIEVPELDLGLLREQITWARKSHEVKEPFAELDWDQSVWAETEFKTEPVAVKNEEGHLTGYVSDDFCGTACCLAGSVAIRRGKPLWQKQPNGNYGACWMSTGDTVEEFAAKQLGLTWREARIMFDENAPIEFLEAMAEGVCIRRGLEF